MSDILIYCGLGLMLIASIYGLFVAIKGYRRQHSVGLLSFPVSNPPDPTIKRLIKIWGILMFAGFVIIGIGMIVN